MPASAWTEFNESDPGIALLQLFGFLLLLLVFVGFARRHWRRRTS